MKWKYRIGSLCLFLGWLFVATKTYAASGVVQFTAVSDTVEKGEPCTVVCQVISDDPFLDVSFQISYDDRYLNFLTGGKKVTGGNGILRVSSVGNTESSYKKTFSLQFEAKKKGAAVIGLEGQASVTDADGNSFSMSSNRLTVTVLKKGSVVSSEPGTTSPPQVTPKPVLSKENRLKTLSAHCLSFSPKFTPDQREYDLSVDASTENLYISYLPMDEKSRVLLKGSEGLTSGFNRVVVRVIAENGEERKYKLNVEKESASETERREREESAEQRDITFSVSRKDDRIFIENSYQFEVLDPSELPDVPAGYIQSNIELNGIQVPAFTMEQDLDNNYLLLYLKGPTGESTLYQYDRREQTLQRYTGNMTERVNRGGTGNVSVSNYVLLIIIVILVILLLSMLIIMLKMAMQRRGGDLRNRGPDL